MRLGKMNILTPHQTRKAECKNSQGDFCKKYFQNWEGLSVVKIVYRLRFLRLEGLGNVDCSQINKFIFSSKTNGRLRLNLFDVWLNFSK